MPFPAPMASLSVCLLGTAAKRQEVCEYMSEIWETYMCEAELWTNACGPIRFSLQLWVKEYLH